jgi:hypothetical protein
MEFINQLITGGPHIAAIWWLGVCLKIVSISPSNINNHVTAQHYDIYHWILGVTYVQTTQFIQSEKSWGAGEALPNNHEWFRDIIVSLKKDGWSSHTWFNLKSYLESLNIPIRTND